MTGMRDVLIYDYFGANAETIWITVTERIREIRDPIEKIAKELSDETDKADPSSMTPITYKRRY